MNENKKTTVNKNLKMTTIVVTLVGIAVLGVLATSNIYSNCKNRSSTGFIGNSEDDGNKLIVNLNTDNFKTTVAKGVVLVDFWASWCGPCKKLAPILDEVAREIDGKAVIGKVNVDHSTSIAQRFDVQYLPTLILFKDGTEIKRLVGVHSKDALIKLLTVKCKEHSFVRK